PRRPRSPRRQPDDRLLVKSVAAMGRWSARRPWRAIVLWLAFAVLCLAAAVATGTESLRNGAVGESARADATLDAHPGARPPVREYAYLHSDTLRAGDPRFRDAAGAASAALATGIGGGVRTERSADGHAVLIGGIVRQPIQVDELRSSVLGVAASHPGVT